MFKLHPRSVADGDDHMNVYPELSIEEVRRIRDRDHVHPEVPASGPIARGGRLSSIRDRLAAQLTSITTWPQLRTHVVAQTKALARSWDLDLLLRTYLFIPRKILRDAIREFGSQLEGKLLDVGCGSQQYREFLACKQYFGIEWSLAKRPPVVADVTQMPFRDSSFDSALCTEVLEHLPEPGRCLAEIHRVVKPGGSVFFTVPMTMYTHSEPYDFYRYTEYGLRYLLEKHGFEIVVVRRLGGVVSVMASHGISLACEAISERLDGRTTEQVQHLMLLPLSAAGSLVLYGLSRVLDGVEQRDAIGWAVLCRRKRE